MLGALLRLLRSRPEYNGRRVFFSTVIRGTNENQVSGYIMEYDPHRCQVINQKEIPVTISEKMWGERGGNRGGRGIVVHKDRLYVATANAIVVFDLNLNELDIIRNEKFGGIHEILVDDEGIWVTSTIHDLIHKVDFKGATITEKFLSKDEVLKNHFGFPDRNLNLSLDFQEFPSFNAGFDQYCKEEIFHINSLVEHRGGVYVIGSRRKTFMKVYPETRVVFTDESLSGPHNCVVLNDVVYVNDTGHQKVNSYDLNSGKRIDSVDTVIYPGKEDSVQFAISGWQRGMTAIDNRFLLVGTSPLTLFEYDTMKRKVQKVIKLSDDVAHCVHAICIV